MKQTPERTTKIPATKIEVCEDCPYFELLSNYYEERDDKYCRHPSGDCGWEYMNEYHF